jgi:hypothetical protein
MSDNIISAQEGRDLLHKLFSERIPVRALLALPTGSSATVKGFIGSITPEAGIVISERIPVSGSRGYLGVAFFDRECEFTFGDVRDLPPQQREELASKFGDTILCLRFPEGEMLALTFTSLGSGDNG